MITVSTYKHEGGHNNCIEIVGRVEKGSILWSLNGYYGMNILFCPFCGEELPTVKEG